MHVRKCAITAHPPGLATYRRKIFFKISVIIAADHVGAAHAGRALRRTREDGGHRLTAAYFLASRLGASRAGILSAWVGTLLVMVTTALFRSRLASWPVFILRNTRPRTRSRRHRNRGQQPRRRAIDYLRLDGRGHLRLPVHLRPERARCRGHVVAPRLADRDRGDSRGVLAVPGRSGRRPSAWARPAGNSRRITCCHIPPAAS